MLVEAFGCWVERSGFCCFDDKCPLSVSNSSISCFTFTSSGSSSPETLVIPNPMLSRSRFPLTSIAAFSSGEPTSSAAESPSSVLDSNAESPSSFFNFSSTFSASNRASAAAARSSLPLLLAATLGLPPSGPLRPISSLIRASSSSPRATPFFPNFFSILLSLCSLQVSQVPPSRAPLFLFRPLLLNVPPQSPSTSLPCPRTTVFPAWLCRVSSDLPDPQNPSPV